MSIIGERLRKLRLNKGLSQLDVAKILNISRPSYACYESGKTKPSRKIKELASLYGVTTDYILGADGADNSNICIDKTWDLIELLESQECSLNGRLLTNKEKEKIKYIIKAFIND